LNLACTRLARRKTSNCLIGAPLRTPRRVKLLWKFGSAEARADEVGAAPPTISFSSSERRPTRPILWGDGDHESLTILALYFDTKNFLASLLVLPRTVFSFLSHTIVESPRFSRAEHSPLTILALRNTPGPASDNAALLSTARPGGRRAR
jgi:hypothetical protein